MAHFIELHQADKERTPLCINVEWIYCVEPYEKTNGSIIKFAIEEYITADRSSSTQMVTVIESYSTIKELLGC